MEISKQLLKSRTFYLFFLVHFIFIREFIFQQALLSEPLNVQVYLVSQSL